MQLATIPGHENPRPDTRFARSGLKTHSILSSEEVQGFPFTGVIIWVVAASLLADSQISVGSSLVLGSDVTRDGGQQLPRGRRGIRGSSWLEQTRSVRGKARGCVNTITMHSSIVIHSFQKLFNYLRWLRGYAFTLTGGHFPRTLLQRG